MLIIRHRVNTIDELRNTSSEYGVEIDVRTDCKELILSHDPLMNGCKFKDWLKYYSHKFIILNVKEEGLEPNILNALSQYGIDKFFFLDQTFPILLRTAMAGERRCAVRISEYESIETVIAMSGYIDWVWVDVFNKLPIGKDEWKKLKSLGLKLCIVSPELVGRTGKMHINKLQIELKEKKIKLDAVCTKNPNLWQ